PPLSMWSCSGNRALNPPASSSSLAEERTPPLAPPQHGGARFPDARSYSTVTVGQDGGMTAQDPDENARRLSGEAIRDGDPTGWFERLYADAAQGQAIVPWDRKAPHPLLVDWIEQQPASSVCRTLVVGSGLGDDAAFLAAHGYRVIAFDI